MSSQIVRGYPFCLNLMLLKSFVCLSGFHQRGETSDILGTLEADLNQEWWDQLNSGE